jgi:LytS/YehU family sensor histidine kinase
VALHYALAALEASRQAETREAEARLLARDAELKALKDQINPHFLFNSLNSISALTTVDGGKAREMCLLLSDFLRSTLGQGDKAAIPLAEELALVRAFLAVEKVRFGSRLTFEEDVNEACAQLLVPPLLLQPLVENAVTHGIGNLLEGGSIRVAAHCRGDALTIAVENDFDPDSVRARKNGLGLNNVRRRLEARFGHHAGLQVRQAGARYIVELSLPAETQMAAQ